MAIEVVCPSCDTSHKVKDESAGKKLKCKGCQKILAIPARAEAAEGDPWDNLDENCSISEGLHPLAATFAGIHGKNSSLRLTTNRQKNLGQKNGFARICAPLFRSVIFLPFYLFASLFSPKRATLL